MDILSLNLIFFVCLFLFLELQSATDKIKICENVQNSANSILMKNYEHMNTILLQKQNQNKFDNLEKENKELHIKIKYKHKHIKCFKNINNT